ncbi:hypothetical protein B0A50_07684 [Salinomyces thailandicus]|uniref:Uncharacterized protein n=1 Tax=Salinomyces thailandicus TaxID=706561 RepID=A0A4U0TMH9_9PEZI|nr:hypothetical protein B0A50_07684 [Salinomyces thailandica]
MAPKEHEKYQDLPVNQREGEAHTIIEMKKAADEQTRNMTILLGREAKLQLLLSMALKIMGGCSDEGDSETIKKARKAFPKDVAYITEHGGFGEVGMLSKSQEVMKDLDVAEAYEEIVGGFLAAQGKQMQ